jgi:hypothetical protein
VGIFRATVKWTLDSQGSPYFTIWLRSSGFDLFETQLVSLAQGPLQISVAVLAQRAGEPGSITSLHCHVKGLQLLFAGGEYYGSNWALIDLAQETFDAALTNLLTMSQDHFTARNRETIKYLMISPNQKSISTVVNEIVESTGRREHM